MSLDAHTIDLEPFQYSGTNFTLMRIVNPLSPMMEGFAEYMKNFEPDAEPDEEQDNGMRNFGDNEENDDEREIDQKEDEKSEKEEENSLEGIHTVSVLHGDSCIATR